MSKAGGKGANKARYIKYKGQGRYEGNKVKRQEKAERLLAHGIERKKYRIANGTYNKGKNV